MTSLISRYYLLWFSLILCSCKVSTSKVQANQLYQLYRYENAIYSVEIGEHEGEAYFIVYNKERQQLFKKEFNNGGFFIDSVSGNNVFCSKYFPIKVGSIPDSSYRLDIVKLKNNNYEFNLVFHKRFFAGAGYGGRLSLGFQFLQKDSACFKDAMKDKIKCIGVNKIVIEDKRLWILSSENYFQIRTVIDSDDTNIVDTYIRSFFD